MKITRLSNILALKKLGANNNKIGSVNSDKADKTDKFLAKLKNHLKIVKNQMFKTTYLPKFQS